MRILIYTHRFGPELVGGAELHLWNLVKQMARMGSWVEVVAARAEEIRPRSRFSQKWVAGTSLPYEEVQIDGAQHPLQIRRFHVRGLAQPLRFGLERLLQKRWEKEEMGMETGMPLDPGRFHPPFLLTGWQLPEQDGENLVRWMMESASVQLPALQDASFHLTGFAPQRIEIEAEHAGRRRVVFQGRDQFQVAIRLDNGPESVLRLRIRPGRRPWSDPRSLCARITQISLSNQGRIHLVPFHVDHRSLRAGDKKEFIASYAQRARMRPTLYNRIFDQLQGPACPGMQDFLRRRAHLYDWVLAGPLPYANLPPLLGLRRKLDFRLALLPLFHVDDDFYYWSHFLDLIREADICLANSWFSNEVFFPQIGARSFVAGAGVDDDLFRRPGIDGARFRKRYGIAEDEKIVLSVGRKSGAKRYHLLIRAVDAIQHRQRCRLVLIGKDEDRKAIISPNVSYLGRVDQDELLDAYEACDVFAMMSESESFGISIIEAWMRGKPVIGSANCAPVAFLVQHDEDGLLAADREELQEALVQLLADPEKCRRLGAQGREKAQRSYTWPVIARKVLDNFESRIQK